MLSTAQVKEEIEVRSVPSEPDTTEVLRRIIAAQQERDVEYSEAEKMGGALITFFETLADVG